MHFFHLKNVKYLWTHEESKSIFKNSYMLLKKKEKTKIEPLVCEEKTGNFSHFEGKNENILHL